MSGVNRLLELIESDTIEIFSSFVGVRLKGCKMIAISNYLRCKYRHISSNMHFTFPHNYNINNNNKSLSSPTSLSISTTLLVSNRKFLIAFNQPIKNLSNSKSVYCKIREKFTASNQIIPHNILYIAQQKQLIHTEHTFRTLTNKSSQKMAKIISGKETAGEIRELLKERVAKLAVKPKLAIVQVGGREDSNVYIRMKIQFAESIGAIAEHIKLSRDSSEEDVARIVRGLNHDASVHGIITQLPFDSVNSINSDMIVNMIDPRKDVDGLNVYNAGKLSHGELDNSSFVPCTPNGCLELIRKSGIKIEGSRSVVLGRSKIVGSPMAQLLLWHNSTTTICHSRTKNIDEICRDADIVVAAVGRPLMVKRSWLKPGAVVIDCGINVIPDSTKKSGTRLVGDVDFDDCKDIAGAITPVPGGVGPMTVAMLISNTVESAARVSSKS